MATIPLATPVKSSRTPQPAPTLDAKFSLRQCRTTGDLLQFHALLLKTGRLCHPNAAETFLESAALHVPGAAAYARKVFDTMPARSTGPYNVMLRKLALDGSHQEALRLFVEMAEESVHPNEHTFCSLLKACSRNCAAGEGKQVHALAVKFGCSPRIFLRNTLIRMYASCGYVGSARKVFDEMSDKDRVSWNSMFAGFSKNGCWPEVVELFRQMLESQAPFDDVTLVVVLGACGRIADIAMGEWIHGYMEANGMMGNTNLVTALVDMYAKCGHVDRAHTVFSKLPDRNVVAWSAMISGYGQANRSKEALEVFNQMRSAGIEPNEVTMVSVLAACAVLGSLETGRWIHAFIRRRQMEVTVELGTALVDFYAKCGDVSSSLNVFEKIPQKNVWSWTVLIRGLASNGQGRKALALFSSMLEAGVQPNDVTFIGVLTACSHAGLLEEGKSQFESMRRDYGFVPRAVHYGCMVDMLGRAGLLHEAYDFIKEMPIDPNAVIWRTLLASCRVHKNVEIGEACLREILRLEPTHSGDYILMSNIYASVGKWDDASRLRNQMKIKGIKKTPGCTLVEVEGVIYEFFAEYTNHPQSKEIYEKVEEMLDRIKSEGYVANTAEARTDVEPDDKEASVSRHSEKLAIAFALLRSPPATPIRIMMNLRICTDCHSAIKLISKVFQRKIIARERTIFHHFKDGSCSCNDYW